MAATDVAYSTQNLYGNIAAISEDYAINAALSSVTSLLLLTTYIVDYMGYM